MGAKSTMEITREDALFVIYQKLLNSSNEKLEEVLEALVGDSWLNNFDIVKDYSSDWHIKYREED